VHGRALGVQVAATAATFGAHQISCRVTTVLQRAQMQNLVQEPLTV